MKFALYTICISPHQLPLAREIVHLIGEDNYAYVYVDELPEDRAKIGWNGQVCSWVVKADDCRAKEVLETADVLMSGIRDLDLFERRSAKGLVTIYSSERWFKPRVGVLRLLSPRYLRMAVRFVRLFTMDSNFMYYPMGIHAASDMARLCGMLHGDLKCLFQAPKLEFEQMPGGRIWIAGKSMDASENRKYKLDSMRIWG